MSIRTKVIALVLTLVFAYVAVLYGAGRWVIYPRFVELENDEAHTNVERAVQALQREVELLIPSVNDWAAWDDSYDYVQDRNPAYVEENLTFESMRGVQIDLLALYDAAGELIWGGAYDPVTKRPLDLKALLQARLPAGDFLLRAAAAGHSLAGILQTSAGPIVLVVKPVLRTGGGGPPKGAILMGRVLDSAALSRLADQAQVNLRVSAVAPDYQTQGERHRDGSLTHTAVSLSKTENETFGETVVLDVRADPALRLTVTTPRGITANGREALSIASQTLGIMAALLVLLFLIGVRRMVLDPLARLTAHATAIGTGNELAVDHGCTRNDEIGVLGREFDRMVERLAEARHKLLEQSYRVGVAESASGVLHNIGNAITPLGVKLGNLKESLRNAPVEEIDLATGELAAPTTGPERRADMVAFLELAARELGDVTRRVLEDVDGISTQVGHVQMILADQQRFSRAERFIESVAVADLVEQALRLLPDDSPIDVTGLGELKRAPRVSTARAALQQVVSNLLINAAEASQGEGQPVVHMCIDAREDLLDGVPMLHLIFADDGAGIPAESLPHIFERGFSTKSRGSGMGLHWCANTIGTLGGTLSAESDGPGRGATMHLLLPRALAEAWAADKAA